MTARCALVAGVTGLIGTRIAERLHENGWDVTGLARRAPQERALAPPAVGGGGSGAMMLDLTINANNQIFVTGRGLDAELGGTRSADLLVTFQQQRRLVELSLASAERLSVMIGELLDLARLRSGAPLEPEPCDPADLARTAVRELAGLALERRIELRERMPEAPMEVWWDGSRVIQLLENLLSNAIRHAPDGSTVDVAVESAGDGVELTVRDHGPGIDDDHKERVFDRFYRGEGRRSGSGLGLAIARSIVDAHGGGIRVEDPAGGGARFVAWLPSRAGS